MKPEDDVEMFSKISDDGFIALVGPIWEKNEAPGQFRFIAEAKHKNRGGFVQGGMLMTFADRAMGTTARHERSIKALATVQFDMQFIRTARIGDAVDIRCEVVKHTRTLIFMEAKLSVGDDVIASAKGIWKIIGSDSSGE